MKRRDQITLQTLLNESITQLCKKHLQFNNGIGIDGELEVTADDAPTSFLLKFVDTGGDVEAVRRSRLRSSLNLPPKRTTRSTRSQRNHFDDEESDNSSGNGLDVGAFNVNSKLEKRSDHYVGSCLWIILAAFVDFSDFDSDQNLICADNGASEFA